MEKRNTTAWIISLFIKWNDELVLPPVFAEMRAFCCTFPGIWAATSWVEASPPAAITRRLNTWTVPLSLETASHCAFGEKEMLYISALSSPLRTYNFVNLTWVINTYQICKNRVRTEMDIEASKQANSTTHVRIIIIFSNKHDEEIQNSLNKIRPLWVNNPHCEIIGSQTREVREEREENEK